MGCSTPCGGGWIAHTAHGAVGLAKATLRIGRPPQEIIAQRRDTCRECPHSSKRIQNGQVQVRTCRVCNCLIAAKTAIASEICCDRPSRWTIYVDPPAH